MKTKLITRIFPALAILAFFAMSAENAIAIENKSRVVSPYWQSDSTSYSFIAVTHPSLSGMASAIGVTVTAIENDQGTFGSATSFTVSAGNTQRVFIVGTNDSTINPTNISTANFIAGSTDFQHGHVRIDPVATTPGFKTGTTDGDGFRDVTMLSYWGAVVIETNTTGFAMEFIGDAHDSMRSFGASASTGVSGVGAP